MKATKLLTHEIARNWESAAADFKKAIEPLKEKNVLSAVLFQLPQSFHYTAENRYYLAALLKAFDGFPNVVEFRHAEWIRDSVFNGLEKRGAGIVFCDMPQLQNLPDCKNCKTSFIGKSAYIRLHGRNKNAWYVHDDYPNGSSRYDYEYSTSELQEFVPVIEAAIDEGKKPQVFFNNHPKGKGAMNAKELKQILGYKKNQLQ